MAILGPDGGFGGGFGDFDPPVIDNPGSPTPPSPLGPDTGGGNPFLGNFNLTEDLANRLRGLSGKDPLGRLTRLLGNLSGSSQFGDFFNQRVGESGLFGLGDLQALLNQGGFFHDNTAGFLQKILDGQSEGSPGEEGFFGTDVGSSFDLADHFAGGPEFFNLFLDSIEQSIQQPGFDPELLDRSRSNVRSELKSREKNLLNRNENDLGRRGIFSDSGFFQQSEGAIERDITNTLANELTNIDLSNAEAAVTTLTNARNQLLSLTNSSITGALGFEQAEIARVLAAIDAQLAELEANELLKNNFFGADPVTVGGLTGGSPIFPISTAGGGSFAGGFGGIDDPVELLF